MRKGVCKHYGNSEGRKRSVIRDPGCGAGLDIRDLVGGSDTGWLRRTPCFLKHNAPPCGQFEEPTDEEIEAYERAIKASLGRVVKLMASNQCIHCETKIEREEQVGHCVYAQPCGHRQGQGTAREVVTP